MAKKARKKAEKKAQIAGAQTAALQLDGQTAASAVIDGIFHVAVAPDSVIARISADAVMPKIPIKLKLNPLYNQNGDLTYSSTIEYTEHGRNDRVSTNGRSASLSFEVDFGSVVQGGAFSIDVQIPVRRNSDGYTTVVPWSGKSNVRGTNPTKATIRTRLGSIELQVIAYTESRFRQFDPNELPLYGPPNGFGVVQIDTPAPTARQVWDWKANVDAGVALYAEKARDARTYPGRVRKTYPDATDFTAAQLKLETYQRFNGGAYWGWNDATKKWAKQDQTGYADRCLAIETQVNSGNPPGEWN